MKDQKSVNRFVLTMLFCFSLTASAFAQSAVIEGQVTNTESKPVADINVALQGTQFGSASNAEGFYTITNIPAGDYTLVVSGIGYTNQRKSISVESGEELTINVTLSSANKKLQEITVEGSKINKFGTEFSEYVAKVPVQNLENPQVYNTVNADLIEDQVITDFDDVLKNAPGVYQLWESTGRSGDGSGYYSIRGFTVQPNMLNGLPSLTNGSLDPANVERVELIKGPSATLFGTSVTSYGGLINVVTKKPGENFGGDISYRTGSFGLNRIAADVNTPISAEKDVALRINGAYHKQNSFQDAGFNESYFLAPSLSYQVNEDLSFLINTELYHSESTNPTMLFLNRYSPLDANNIDQLNYNNENSYTTNDLTISNPVFRLQGKMNYIISDQWTSETVLSRSSAKSNGYYSYISTIGIPGTTYDRYISDQNATTLGTDIQQNFNGDFEIAGLRNRMVIGLDFFQQNVINNSTGYIAYDSFDMSSPDPVPAISKAAVDTMLANAGVGKSRSEQQVYSAYISDVVNIIPEISVMLGLRLDHFVENGSPSTENDDFEQTTLSPKVGVVLQPIKDKVSLFANYMNSFNNVAPVTVGNDILNFEPERANQWEAGIKTSLLNDRLTAMASYYDIRVSNIVRQDPSRPNYQIQDGENYSRGVEFSLNASPVNGLNITAGYSHNNSEVTVTSNDAIRGRRPERAGPSDLVNGWISYRFTSGTFKGFGLGLGGNYASDNYVINRSTTGRFTIPSYTVFNGSIFYDAKTYRLDLKFNNFTDEEYYNGWSTVNPQRPRAITAGFTYKF